MNKFITAAALSLIFAAPGHAAEAEGAKEKAVAEYMSEMMVAGRAVVSKHQDLFNDPEKGDKEFTAAVFSKRFVNTYENTFGKPFKMTDAPMEAQAMLTSMQQVVDEAQPLLNKKGVGYKGFIPASFTRLVFEKFAKTAPGIHAKFTSVPDVHNPANKPDAWEEAVLRKFLEPGYPKGQPYSEVVALNGKKTLRFIRPEYFVASCLKCHGGPIGEKGPGGIVMCGKQVGQGGAGFSLAFAIKDKK